MADTFWGDAAEDMHKTAQAKVKSFENHPSAIHFKNAVKHYKKAVDAYHSGAGDEDVVKHWDRGDKHMAKGEKMTLESEDLDEGNKINRQKRKEFDLKRGKAIAAASRSKEDTSNPTTMRQLGRIKKEEVNIDDLDEGNKINELSKGTLGSYVKKAARQSISTAFTQGNNRNDDLSSVVARAKKLKKRERGIGKAVDKITKEEIEVDEALVAKATLERYRAKSKAKFREKGGINAALEKQDKVSAEDREKLKTRRLNFVNEEPIEEIEQIDELSPKTLKSYTKKATTSAQRAWDKGDKEEDKAMSTDGYKYPEKQARHQAAASVQHTKWAKRNKGLERSKRMYSSITGQKFNKEEAMPHIVDTVMVNDELDAQPYIDSIEVRCDALVSEIKDEMKKTLFNFSEGK